MGELLSGKKLFDILSRSERIFSKGSWSKDQLKGSGYDLRLAGDLLVIPPSPGDPGHVRFGLGEIKPSFTLAPGDSAVISTMEECTFDFNISAIIGPKFGLASMGILTLQGMAAHPGYGREERGGKWVPKERGERLYFIVVNVGPDYVVMQRGQTIAFLQIFEVDSPVEKAPVKNIGIDGLSGLFRTDSARTDGGLRYFRMVRDVQDKVTAIDTKVSYVESAVDRVTNTSNMIVVFGVFLVSTTVLGFVLTMLVSLIEKFSFHVGSLRDELSVGLMTLYGASTVLSLILVNSAVRRAVGKKTTKRRRFRLRRGGDEAPG
jgi:deoxycytidine triphosphate deaminase